MTRHQRTSAEPAPHAFEEKTRLVPITAIAPLKQVPEAVRKSVKYAQIAASIRSVGLVEPPVIARDRDEAGKYLLLDGHLRLSILKDMGQEEVTCLISTDDEAFTYNKRVNRLAVIQEHKMILKALERGVPEARIAQALNVNVGSIKRKRHLLDSICDEAADLLKDKDISINALWELKKLKPFRQIEVAELMISMNKYTIGYAQSLVAATPQSQLVAEHRPKAIRGMTEEQVTLMERESANLEREFKVAEKTYSADHLDLVLAKGYLAKLVGNARVVRYLNQKQPELLSEFRKIAEIQNA